MTDPERKAINLKQNAGLWKGQLWDEGFEASRVQQRKRPPHSNVPGQPPRAA